MTNGRYISTNLWRDNCLNSIRLLAALSVMYIHAVAHLDVDVPEFVTTIFSMFPGVPIFFFLSGFLVWNSIGKSNGIVAYAKKRFWRIYPQLWTAVVLSIVIIIFQYNKPIEFAKLGIFAITQGTIMQFWTPEFLREYGCGTPNGALWTIGITIQFYIVAYFVYKLIHKKNIFIWIAWIVFSVFVTYLSNVITGMFPSLISKLYNQLVIRYLWIFLTGAMIAEKNEIMVPFLKKYWMFFVGVAMFFYMFPQFDLNYNNYNILFCIFQVVGLLGVAYRYPGVNIKFDISYGIYLYHMIVINVMIELGFSGKIQNLVIAMLLSIVLAYISEKTIGQFSIKKKVTDK